MNENDYIVMLKGVNDKKEFFAELLVFFAPYNVILSVWGKLTPKVLKQLALFKAPCSWIRRLFFSETEWNLTPQSLSVLKQCLCNDEFLGNLTWGIRKDGTPLGLCRSWDDMDLNGSELIDETTLFRWIDDIKNKGLLKSYEKITD